MKIILTMCAAMLLFIQPQVRAHIIAAAPEVMLNPDVMPSFEGGDQIDFLLWVTNRIIYPEEAKEQKIEGKVVISFIIEKNGKLKSPEILSSPDDLLSEEVLRVLNTSPRWTPGRVNGASVRTRLTIPVTFKLQEEPQEPVETEGEILPRFRGNGDMNKFGEWVGEEVLRQYKNIDFEGIVIVQFTVETDGSIQVALVLESTNDLLAAEIVRVIRQSPTWTPGYKDGKPVEAIITLPITFKAVDTRGYIQ